MCAAYAKHVTGGLRAVMTKHTAAAAEAAAGAPAKGPRVATLAEGPPGVSGDNARDNARVVQNAPVVDGGRFIGRHRPNPKLDVEHIYTSNIGSDVGSDGWWDMSLEDGSDNGSE